MDTPNGTTLIGTDTTITGELKFNNNVKILGKVDGTIGGEGELHIGESAACKATIDAGKINVDGSVEGNITARDRAVLNSKARLQGDLVAPKLIIEEGASFVGHCRVGPDAKNAPAPTNTPAVETKPVKPEVAKK